MRNVLLILFMTLVTGCVSVKIPKYLQEESSYKKKYYASFDETLAATKKTLQSQGWVITDTADPIAFEQNQDYDPSQGKRVLLFTEPRQTSMILFSRYSALNAYVRTLANDSTEVELRYHSETPVFFAHFKTSKNDHFIEKLFERIAQDLEK